MKQEVSVRMHRNAISLAVLALINTVAWGQETPATADSTATQTIAPIPFETTPMQQVAVTGTRIRAASLTSTSPVSQFSDAEIALTRAVTVEDFSMKLPQLASGANGTSAGSDDLERRPLTCAISVRAGPWS